MAKKSGEKGFDLIFKDEGTDCSIDFEDK